ncbi:hypothetical protein [Hespellia stercorisuis]|uniref:Maleate cis-trans isomerase n=1 Tax=Hespellia stercorisuis DSM 15480 TaxID=1121950 RepID=A0A1M6M8E1_9FIRM|nr:hypothetical protein [Hespellia stercorisuis]SHJ79722.1 Maleate cis-trans isomerase [Hespellia stercorisuis DSM 15480]
MMEKNRNQFVVGVINVINTLSTVIEQEFRRGMPENVELVMSYAPLEVVSYEGLMGFLDSLPDRVEELAQSNPDIIVVPSMTGSCIRGFEIVNILEQCSGLPVIVPSLEMEKLLKRIGADKIAIVSAFGVELGLIEQLFFGNHGIEVTKMINVFDDPSENREIIDQIDSHLILEKVKQADFGDVKAVIFDSPTYRLRPIIDEVRRYIKVPMLSVNQVLLYSTLEKLGLSVSELPITEFFPENNK